MAMITRSGLAPLNPDAWAKQAEQDGLPFPLLNLLSLPLPSGSPSRCLLFHSLSNPYGLFALAIVVLD